MTPICAWGPLAAGGEDASAATSVRQTNALMPVSARPISSFWICDVPS